MPRSAGIYCFTQRLEVIVLKAFVYFTTGFCESRFRLGALIDKLLLSVLLFGIRKIWGWFWLLRSRKNVFV